MAGQVWLEAKALQSVWAAFVRAATLPLELAHALHVLDAHMAPTVRTRTWGIERSGRWRHQIVESATIASVATQLILLDECCCWDYLEKQLTDPKKATANSKSARTAPKVRPRMSVADFAVAMGERSPVLEWCEYAPAPDVLRAGSGGDLFTLTPSEEGGWNWICCGKYDPLYTLDLRGLNPAEAKGARLTVRPSPRPLHPPLHPPSLPPLHPLLHPLLHPRRYDEVVASHASISRLHLIVAQVWYEEERSGKLVDVPYVGVVLSVHMRDGMAVQFPDVIVDGNPEELVIGNEVRHECSDIIISDNHHHHDHHHHHHQ